MMEIREVSIADILSAREIRAENQRRLLKKHCLPVISFTMNIAGPVKNDEWIERAFYEGVSRIQSVLSGRRAHIAETISSNTFTGCEQLWAINADAESLKRWMRLLEEQDALGRLFDIDVIDSNGAKLSRESERRCLVCGGPVRVCARSRVHSVDEISQCTHKIIENYFLRKCIRKIGTAAEKALLYEVATTPKPGLVDFENCGAHNDMDRFTFIDSACSLRGYFELCAEIGAENSDANPEDLFERIRSAGQQAESEMLAATDGVNTHKGAIFSLGILCCAAGMCFPLNPSVERILENASALGKFSLSDFERLSLEKILTGGELQFLETGLTGARGEAASGFPSVRNIALPALNTALSDGKDINDAGLSALLALMSSVTDSNVLRRAGKDGLKKVQYEASHAEYSDLQSLREMDAHFIQQNLSPGGCADLLAAAWFLHEIAI